MKKTALLCLAILLLLSGCVRQGGMPFNGKVTFHEITATVPDSFLRDSTQSNDDLWVFEKGGYDQILLLSRKDIGEDPDAALDGYVTYLRAEGADAERGQFLYADAVHATYTKDGQYCQEILFVYHDSLYSVALRGGTEEDFQAILDEVNTPETEPMNS